MNFRASKRRRVEAVIDITSLVDVVFLLIIFLLVTTTFKKKEFAFPLELPTATEQQLEVNLEEDQTVVYLTSDGQFFYLDGQEAAVAAADGPLPASEPLDRAALEKKLQELAKRRPDVELTVKGQKDAPYQHFMDVMDACRKVGLQNVLLPYELVQGGDK